MNRVVMQPRCIHCKNEHYAFNVYDVSHGTSACHTCGRTPPAFGTTDEYRAAFASTTAALIRREAQASCRLDGETQVIDQQPTEGNEPNGTASDPSTA